MISSTTKPDYEKATELANAMRRGLQDLRSTPVAPDTSLPSSRLTDLAAYADLHSLPPLAKSGRITSPVVRGARSFLRALMRPWLAVQTEFNQGVMAELNDLRRRLSALEKSSPAAMPVALHRDGIADEMPLQGQGHGALESSPSAAATVRQGPACGGHRHEADQERAVS